MQPTLRPSENINAWNVFFSFLFAFCLFASLILVAAKFNGFPRYVPLLDIALMMLAVQRLTRLLVYDKIMRWFRDLFVYKRELISEDGSRWTELIPYGRGLRHTIYDLLQCPWCIGVWASLLVVFSYFMFPWAWYVIFMLAVASAGSLLQVLANGVGWRAESFKLDARDKERTLKL